MSGYLRNNKGLPKMRILVWAKAMTSLLESVRRFDLVGRIVGIVQREVWGGDFVCGNIDGVIIFETEMFEVIVAVAGRIGKNEKSVVRGVEMGILIMELVI